MQRGLAVLAGVLLTLAFAALPPAASLYDQVVPRVIEAKRVLEKDPAQALVLVEDAQRAFARGKDQLPPVIAAGIEQALKDARVSVARKSKADLEGRLWVVRGAFAKALYDAFFDAVARGDLEAARALLDRLIEASARSPALKAKAWALAEKGDLEGLRRLFEKAYLEAIVKSLDLAGDGENRVHSYALVSKAYGLFLIVQDSPRVGDVRPKDFVEALSALASGDIEGYRTKVAELKDKLAQVLEGYGGVAPVAAAPPPKPRPAAAPAPPAAPKPKPKPAAAAPAAPRAPAAKPPAPTKPARIQLPARRGDQPTYEEFVEDLVFLIENRKKAEKVAQELISAGVHSVDQWRDQLYVTEGYVATAQAYLSTGQPKKAKTYLEQARARYLFSLYPLVEAADPALAKETDNFFQKLTRGLGLRSSDVAVLAVALERVRRAVFEEPVNTWFDTQIKVEKATFGLPRAILFLIVGALALFPVYLVWLTFGGRNIYWRLLGYALFFLFIPAIFEGLSYLGDILAHYGGLPQLLVLTNLSIFQSVVMQLLWGLLIFVVVVLAGWGLRGIAQQFGLLPERRSQSPVTQTFEEYAQGESQGSAVVEWDEEF